MKLPWLPRSYLRFSLQSLLLLVLSLCLGLGWWRDHRRLSQEIHDLKHPVRGWDTDQVLGSPDTPGAGDIRTAWASATQDGQDEWLLLEYEQAVAPNAVVVHETFNPGAVSKVSVFGPQGEELIAWQGTDPTPATNSRGVSVIPINVKAKTYRIKLYIDSMAVAGWNEIDAVGLRYGKNDILWAERAYASSSYGRNNELPRGVGGYRFVW